MARSSTEAEHVAFSDCIQEAIWLKSSLLRDLVYLQLGSTRTTFGAMELRRNPKFHNRTKHIDIHYHLCRQHVMDGFVKVMYCPTSEVLADVFTMPLAAPAFKRRIAVLDIVLWTRLKTIKHHGGLLQLIFSI